MYTHVVGYSESVGQVTNSDINAAEDLVLTIRNSHLILTEPFNLLAVAAFGDSLSRLRFGNQSMQQIGIEHVWPLNVGATNPDRPAVYDLRDYPIELPQDEEITLEATTTAVGPAQHGAILWLGKPEWTRNLPNGIRRFTTRATAVVAAGSETTWTAPVNLTFERDLLHGTYAVIGCNVVAANARAFRLRFPDQPIVGNKQLRPGGLVQDTATLIPWPAQSGGFGEWGRFHTFTPPQLEVFADAAGGIYEVRLEVVYLGKGRELLGFRG